MGKHLLLLSYACILLPIIFASCSASHKATTSKSPLAKTTTDARDIGSIYAASHPRTPIGKNWTTLTQSPARPMPIAKGKTGEPVPEGSITLVEEPLQIAGKRSKLKKAPSALKDIKAGAPVAVVPASPDATRANGQQVRSDTIDLRDAYQAPNGKEDNTDTKEPVSFVISKTNGNEANPAPSEINDEADLDARAVPAVEIDAIIGKYADMISVPAKEIKNYQLYRFIDEWYGTEYKWGGEDNTGIDCSAFSQKLYGKVYDIEIMRTARQQHRSCERIKSSSDAEQGDLVFFRTHHLRISHVGVYLANGYFVHCSSSQGVVISSLKSKYWRRRFAGCGRIAKNEPDIESESMP